MRHMVSHTPKLATIGRARGQSCVSRQFRSTKYSNEKAES